MSISPLWRMFIDTGGTFTDCLAIDPDGKKHLLKVLSTGTLRGTLLYEVKDPQPTEGLTTYKISHSWPVQTNIFSAYTFRLLSQEETFSVVNYSPSAQTLTINGKLADRIHNRDFEISAYEEAPILAARILTATPLSEPLPQIEMRLGTTKGTNALLERKGAKVGLLITKGFKDLLLIGNQQRADLFSLKIEKPEPIAYQTWEVNERIAADGKVIHALASEEVERLVSQLTESECEVVAISLLHAYRNPVHEKILSEAFIQAGFRYISIGSHLSSTIKILPRTETAVINGYLSPTMDTYLSAVQEKLSGGNLYVMTSAGGLAQGHLFEAKDSLLSGPAGGLVGAALSGKECGFEGLITFDMGGTSTDVARYFHQFDYQYQIDIEGITLSSPGMVIETVAAGGGSICGYDGQKLFVGPESAGAYPGPACYGAGGPLTITDVNLLLGRLDPQSMDIPIHVEAAEKALAQIQSASGEEEHSLLSGFLQIAHEKMAAAIKRISISKGFDPASYVLVAFGGAGGQHACAVAEELGMQKVIIPAEAGILSAKGIGHAAVERFASQQVLAPLQTVEKEFELIFERLEKEGIRNLQEENVTGPFAVQAWTYMRLAGQEYALEVSYPFEESPRDSFRKQYISLFGHWIEDKIIEVESCKVIVSASQYLEIQEEYKKSYAHSTPDIQNPSMSEKLEEILGPKLLKSAHHTIFIQAGWKLVWNELGHAILEPISPMSSSPAALQSTKAKSNKEKKYAAITQLELFTNRFRAVVEEMGAQLERTAFSVNVKERMDFSCALLDPQGYLVANAPHIPVHLGSMGMCVRSVLEVLPAEKGSVLITNHPGFGGSHLPDITLIQAVYSDQEELLGFVANRAHHAEIGGIRPGSMPPNARTLVEEGVVINPQYIVKEGEVQWGKMRAVFLQGPFPTRSIKENIADLSAGLASLTAGAQAVKALAAQYGKESLFQYMKALQTYAHQLTRQALSPFRNHSFYAQELLDDGAPLAVKLLFHPESIQIDFLGSGPVHMHNLNATPAIVHSVIMYVLRLMLAEDIPLNEGILTGIRIHIPEGMLAPPFPANPAECPAVVGGNTEVSQRLTDTLIKAFSLAACSQGTMNNVLFGNEKFGYYETIGGGTGAGDGFHGKDAIHHHMTNTRMTDPEIHELRYPVRILTMAIRQDSGGRGKWRGGNGMIRRIQFLEDLQLSVISQHRKVAPFGMNGGEKGKVGEQYLLRTDGTKESLEGIVERQVKAGDIFTILTPGGGGYGRFDLS